MRLSSQVTATERASAALSMIQEGGQYELILADVNMLEMDIFKFIKGISQYNLPIVVMASREDMIKAEKVIRECKVSLLGKPFQAKSILNVWQHVHRMKRIPIKETTVASSTVADNLSEQTSNVNANGMLKPIEEEKGQKMKNTRHLSSRMIWTPDLHSRFVEALNALGEQKAHPKALLRKMDVPFLTHRHIASHLQNLLNSSTPNSDVIPGCLENFNHLSLPIPGQMEETKYLRDIEEGASNQIEAMSGVATSSLNEEQGSSLGVYINMIAQLLENEDLENFGDIGGDDVDRYSQWLSAPSNN